jgi:hypothetical protein
VKERGYKSILKRKELADLGFSKAQQLTPGLLIPVHTPDGSIPLYQIRPDNPRKNKQGKAIKYETPSGSGIRIDVSPRCREKLKDPSTRLWITEGVKKGDALATKGECVIALLGVYGFKGQNEFGGTTVLADFDYIALEGREVNTVFDSDIMTKAQVKKALERLTEHLQRKEAKVHHIYLPLSGDNKMGVDDYLLDHSVDELLSLSREPETQALMHDDIVPNYSFHGGHLYRYKYTKEGLIPVRLANFDARIIEENILDNGLETSHFYKVEGRNQIRSLGIIEIPASSFSGMNWVHNLGHNAILEPGLNTKDYVRHNIQSKSQPNIVRKYTHTGWREDEGDWIYLSCTGALGKENINVSLPHELNRYAIPTYPENEINSIKASLDLLGIGKRSITIPLLVVIFLSSLTSLLNPMPNFSPYLYGGTGTFKTTLAILFLSHFGPFESVENLSNFEDTGNALGRRAFTLKDKLMVVDDFHPSTQRYLSQQKEAIAQRLIREFSNRTERGRLNPDSTEKPRYIPRGMLLITGEDIISVQSSLARIFIIEVAKGDIDIERLSELQSRSNLLPHAMSSHLHWIRNEGIRNMQMKFREKFPQLRAQASDGLLHHKLPEQVAFLQFAMSNVLNWALDKKVISDSKAKELVDESWEVFTSAAKAMQNRIGNEDPVSKFIDILSSLIFQKKVNISHKNNGGEFIGGKVEGPCEPIGWYDNDFYYLLPTPLWKAINSYAFASREDFPVSKNTLYMMLGKRNIIDTRDRKHTIPFKHKGEVYRVLRMKIPNYMKKEVTEVTKDGSENQPSDIIKEFW